MYLRRFESRKIGKSGHVPACANEWVRGICEKPRISGSPSQRPSVRTRRLGEDPALQDQRRSGALESNDRFLLLFIRQHEEIVRGIPLSATADFVGNAETISGDCRPANAFNGRGRMEVDLLGGDSRVVVEVDGALSRLRFLAEDLAKELDWVLDGILRSLSAR